MKQTMYKKDINRVEITGEIRNLPDFVRYIPTEKGVRPLLSFDCISFRGRKSEEDDWKTDDNKVVIFDNEEFLKVAKEGDRYRFIGELQSRNYNRVNEEMDEMIAFAVQNYFMSLKKYPTVDEVKGKKKGIVDWKELMKYGLIPEVPSDSMYNEDMVKEKTQDTPFIYLIDGEGEVTKESQHVTYEIVAVSFEKLEEPVDALRGDTNKVKMAGKITRDPFFNLLGMPPTPFVNFNVGMKSEFFPDHMFFNNAIAWGKTAQDVFEELREGDYVMFKGRLQSRPYVKKFTKRWETPGGNKKKKVIELPLKTREVSVSYIEKLKRD